MEWLVWVPIKVPWGCYSTIEWPEIQGTILKCLIFQIRKNDGSEFPPDTLHHIVSGIQRYLRWNGNPGIDLFKDACFADFRMCLDSEMKRLQRAEPLTEEEELLWNKGLRTGWYGTFYEWCLLCSTKWWRTSSIEVRTMPNSSNWSWRTAVVFEIHRRHI